MSVRWSEISVIPKNWRAANADVSTTWIIYYYFYDDEKLTEFPKGKQVKIKGLSKYKELKDRQAAVRGKIEAIQDALKAGYNPITGIEPAYAYVPEIKGVLPNDANIVTALNFAADKKKCVPALKMEFKSMIKYIAISAVNMGLISTPVTEISRRHIKALFEQLAVDKAKAKKKHGVQASEWTDNVHNKYRRNLMMLFAELVEWEVVETNPVIGIKIKDHIAAKKQVLTKEQIELINTVLPEINYRFWRVIQIFFHSGSRSTEFMMLKYEDVNIEKQEITYTINKGITRREMRPMKNIIVPLWKEIIDEATPGDYLFTHNLKPSPTPIRSDQLKRRWAFWVQKKLGIKGVGMYSLKHLNSTQVASLIGTKLAARLNAHGEKIFETYDIDGAQRQMDIIKGVGNKL